jgi:hypothetical protein
MSQNDPNIDGEDKAYDTADHVANLRASNVTPHVTQNDSPTKTSKRRKSAIDGRTTHSGHNDCLATDDPTLSSGLG